MAVLVLVEQAAGELTEPSAQALTLAHRLADGQPLDALLVGSDDGLAASLGRRGVGTLHVATVEGSYAPAAWAAAAVELAARLDAAAVVAAGTEVGNEVLAHVAARLDLPFAANCIDVTGGAITRVTRTRWGGSLLEEATVHGAPAVLSVQPHAVAAVESGAGDVAVERFTPALAETDLVARIVEHVPAPAGGVSLADAKVVVSGGRGVGSAEGFAIVEELAGLLGGAVGCSRVVTSAGWRPHTDQVGQTGTKISPELYIPCGISGATQHIAGCRGAKRILAVNADPEAPIFASADYAVVGDLHEILPAISAEIRKARGA
jgi:electron transfer flavoprotein alpha subunit